MAEYVLFLSLPGEPIEVQEGTVVEVGYYPYQFCVGDLGTFLPIRVETDLSISKLRVWRMRKCLPLAQFINDVKKGQLLAQKTNIQNLCFKEGKILKHGDLTVLHDLDKKYNLDKLVVEDQVAISHILPAMFKKPTEE